MERNKFEQEVKAKMEQRTLQPSPMAWDRLDAMLSVTEQKKPKVTYRWMYIAATMLLFLGAGMFFLNRDAAEVNGSSGAESVVNVEDNSAPAKETPGMVPALTTPAEATVAAASEKSNLPSVAKTTVPVSEKIQLLHEDAMTVAVGRPDSSVENSEGEAVADLAAVADAALVKSKNAVKVDSRALLSSVEGELDDSFRSKVLQSVAKNYNTVKTALVNRNHE